MKAKDVRRLGIGGALLAALAGPLVGSVVMAQDGSPSTETTTTTTQTDDNDFPWGLLGLLGLGGLAGLTRREAPRRVETVDASRR